MKKLKVGIVGIGGIGKNVHLPAWTDNVNVEVVALCDILEERAIKAAKEYGIRHTFKDYMDLINMENIDVVVICTPNYLHSTISVEAFKKGKHVFCEKPDAINLEEALKMKKASEESGKLLMVMRNNRFIGTSQYLKNYINQGHMGEIYAAKCGWLRRRGIPGKGGWFTTKEQSGGGPLIDLGVHMIDLAIWLMGNPTPVSVVGSTYCKFAEDNVEADSEHAEFGDTRENGIFDVEDLAMGFIKFENGTCLSIEFSWATNIERENRYVELLGTKMGSKWNSSDNVLKLFGEINGATVDILPNVDAKGGYGHKENIDHFVECLLDDVEPIFTPQQGVDMIKILDSIYRSAELGEEIKL